MAQTVAPKSNGKDETAQADLTSTLVFEFLAPGMAEFNLRTLGKVTPAQMLAVSAWLTWFAERQFDLAARRVEEAVARPGLIVPTNLRGDKPVA